MLTADASASDTAYLLQLLNARTASDPASNSALTLAAQWSYLHNQRADEGLRLGRKRGRRKRVRRLWKRLLIFEWEELHRTETQVHREAGILVRI